MVNPEAHAFLQFNRFRPIVRVIRAHANPGQRVSLFVAALLGENQDNYDEVEEEDATLRGEETAKGEAFVREYLSCCYLLVNENPDLLVQVGSRSKAVDDDLNNVMLHPPLPRPVPLPPM